MNNYTFQIKGYKKHISSLSKIVTKIVFQKHHLAFQSAACKDMNWVSSHFHPHKLFQAFGLLSDNYLLLRTRFCSDYEKVLSKYVKFSPVKPA